MTIRKLEKNQWRPFLDTLSSLLEAKDAEIEVTALNIGVQIQAEWVPLIGVGYDPKDDIVDIELDGLDHIIHHPRDIYLDNGGSELTTLEIVDAEGIKHIIKLKDRLALAAPGE